MKLTEHIFEYAAGKIEYINQNIVIGVHFCDVVKVYNRVFPYLDF